MIWLILSGSGGRKKRGLWAAILALALAVGAPGAAGGQNLQQPVVRLLAQSPIEAVTQAVGLARRQAPIPSALNPASASVMGLPVAANCVPSFGSGTTYDLCSLGAVRSPHLVVVLGDSHAWMWIPALVGAATKLGFRLVPITKPGCALWALHQNRPQWPCLSWWVNALRTVRRLRPSATVVSFLTGNYPAAQAGFAANALQRVLQAVPHPVLLADPPSDDWYTPTVPTPSECMTSPGGNLGRCALHETPAMRASLTQIQTMVNADGYPAIPTLQWFCADTICPTVIAGTVTTEDGNHLTPQYTKLLAPRLTAWLRPILRRLWNQEARATRSGAASRESRPGRGSAASCPARTRRRSTSSQVG